uniref:RVT_N domain-containing protein n=1 Tax=Mesocestoides corti TaxID=53468 RepID=A0A5K3EI45_MESCO
MSITIIQKFPELAWRIQSRSHGSQFQKRFLRAKKEIETIQRSLNDHTRSQKCGSS